MPAGVVKLVPHPSGAKCPYIDIRHCIPCIYENVLRWCFGTLDWLHLHLIFHVCIIGYIGHPSLLYRGTLLSIMYIHYGRYHMPHALW